MPFDRPTEEIPFEERAVVDRELLASFGQRAASVLAPLVPDPLIREFWPLVTQRAAETTNLGECLAQSRHSLEGQWGLATLELPQSHVCRLPAFHWFTAHVLAHLPRFSHEYNDAVRAYRRANHVRSANHPVPDLAADGEWLEAPFWLWTSESPRRRRLFASFQGQRLVLTDRRQIRVELPLSVDGDGAAAVEVLADLPRRGIKLRSRALLTTLFARLVLGDVFLHGIGGAKYDQLTDWLFERFFGLVPPEFMVLSATLHLPLAGPRVSVDDVPRIDRQLWELRHHPERFLRTEESAARGRRRSPTGGWRAKRTGWPTTRPTARESVASTSAARMSRFSRGSLRPDKHCSPSASDWPKHSRHRRSSPRASTASVSIPTQTLRDFLLAFLSGRP